MTIPASSGKYPRRSPTGLSLHCPQEASWEGMLPRIAPYAWLMSTRLGWKITDINRKAKQVERILSNRLSKLTFAKIIHLVGYLHVSWSWKYISFWKSAVSWTGISSSSPGRFPNIYISSHYFTLILLFPSKLPSWNFNSTPPPKLLLPILLVLIIFINRKLKSGIALSRAENYGFHSMPLKATPYVQSAKCQRRHLVLRRGRKDDCKWDSVCGASKGFPIK